MKDSMAYAVIVIGLARATLLGSEGPDEKRPDAVSSWEYRILMKEQIIELGKKDLTAGLNKLGEQGWELAAVETAFIFKRANLRMENGSKR
jgi:hypothetical protein